MNLTYQPITSNEAVVYRTQSTEAAYPGYKPITRKRILLVDDAESFRLTLGQILQQADYEVRSVGDGSAALRLFRKLPFDLVITDLIMPEKEGLETIIEMHRLQQELKILAISGGGQMGPDDYLSMARHLGAAATLAKPFTPQQILEVVARLLGNADDLPRSSQ